MTTAALVAKVHRIDAAMEANRTKLGDLAAERAEAIRELYATLGPTEAGRRLGVSKSAVYKAVYAEGRRRT